MRSARAWCWLALAGIAVSCGPKLEPPFPPTYRREWSEDRTTCTLSHDHELRYIRVFTDPAAHAPYLSFSGPMPTPIPYPTGARILKEEYDDAACTHLASLTLMTRLREGSAPTELDWRWERYTPDLQLDTSRPMLEPARCVSCHTCHCGALPFGWQYSCSPLGLEPSGCAR